MHGPSGPPYNWDHDKSAQLTAPATRSINILGVDIYQECIDGLHPRSMVNDNIVSYLLEQVKLNSHAHIATKI